MNIFLTDFPNRESQIQVEVGSLFDFESLGQSLRKKRMKKTSGGNF